MVFATGKQIYGKEIIMPLNIDWQQILLHVFNFLILVTGLSLILFKPVRKFMHDREEKYKTTAAEHERKTAEIAELEKQREEKLAGLDGEMEARRKELVSRSEKEGRRIIAEAEERAQGIVAEGQKRAQEERAAYMAKAGDEIADMVVRSAEKLLVVGSTPENDSALYDSYLKTAQSDITVSGVSAEAKATLAERLKRSLEDSDGAKGDDVADIVGKATLAAMEKTRTAESDGAVYDEFLKSVNGGKANG